MNFLADPGGANRAAGGNAAELSLEEALAFFDGYDDHTLQQQQQHLSQQHMHQQHTQHTQQQHHNVAAVSAQMYQQPQPQPQHFAMTPTSATDMLMMMDDAVAPSDFGLGDASVSAFLYSATPTVTGATATVHSCANVAMLDSSMNYNSADFGMMASMLQPLHLDDPTAATATTPSSSDALAPPLPSVEASPMQALLAAPLLPTAPPASADAATAAPATIPKTTRIAARAGRPQRIKPDPNTGASKASAASAPRTTVAARTAPKAAGASAPAISSSVSAGSGRPTATTNPPSTKRVRRQKEELLYLRAKVVEMEERLQQLKRVNGEAGSSVRGSPAPSSSDDPDAPAAASSSSPTPASGGGKKRRSDESSETDDDAQSSTESSSSSALSPPAISPALLASVWENVAERQYKERLRAEQQNKKLKTMLEGQIKLATSLEKILKKRPNMEVLYPDTDLKAPGAAQRVIAYNDSDADVFAKQLADVEDAFPRTDDVLAASGFFPDGDESTRHDFNVKDYPDDDGVIMEFMAATTVPYDLDITGNALWRFMSDVAVKKHCYFEEVVESTDDRVSRSFGVRMSENGKDVDMRGKHTLRKYVAHDRVVLVWASLMEPLQIAGAHVTGLRFSDIGWLVAQRATVQQGATLIKAFGHLSPLLPEDSGDDDEQQDARIGVLTDFVINSHETNAALCLQLINDLLVEEEWKATLPVAL